MGKFALELSYCVLYKNGGVLWGFPDLILMVK